MLIFQPLAIEKAPCPLCGVGIGKPCVFSVKEEAVIRSWTRPHDSPLKEEPWRAFTKHNTCHTARCDMWWRSRDTFQLEVERCHAALDSIYEQLMYLEPTLTVDQIRLLPIDECKWRKDPEWENRYAHRQSATGAASYLSSLRARIKQLREAFPDAPIPSEDP